MSNSFLDIDINPDINTFDLESVEQMLKCVYERTEEELKNKIIKKRKKKTKTKTKICRTVMFISDSSSDDS